MHVRTHARAQSKIDVGVLRNKQRRCPLDDRARVREMNDRDVNKRRCFLIHEAIIPRSFWHAQVTLYTMLPKAEHSRAKRAYNEPELAERSRRDNGLRIWSNLPVGLSLRNRVSITALSTGVTSYRWEFLLACVHARNCYNRTRSCLYVPFFIFLFLFFFLSFFFFFSF